MARFSIDSSFFIVVFLNDFKLVKVQIHMKILKLYDSYLFYYLVILRGLRILLILKLRLEVKKC
jgi:hypothetical protein